jgi:hypothetical protein
MRLRLRVLILVFLSLELVACKINSPKTTPSSPALQPELFPTPTPTTAVLFPSEVPGYPKQSGGEVEIRIPFDIYSQGELPSTNIAECINKIPFSIIKDESRTLIEGQGQIDCDFVDTPQGAPITYHVVLAFAGMLNGELLPATPDKPSGWVDAYLMVNGAIIQVYTDYPQEAINPCPESNPCRTPISETIPLPFAYEEGNTITTPWIFILHSQKSSD